VLLEERKRAGFMELYYLLLAKLGQAAEIYVNEPNFMGFIDNCLSGDESLKLVGLKNLAKTM